MRKIINDPDNIVEEMMEGFMRRIIICITNILK